MEYKKPTLNIININSDDVILTSSYGTPADIEFTWSSK